MGVEGVGGMEVVDVGDVGVVDGRRVQTEGEVHVDIDRVVGVRRVIDACV